MKEIKIIVICLIIFLLTGCSGPSIKQDKPGSYTYSADSRFKVVRVENIDDGTINGITISILVDKETKVMYMQTEKYWTGYGLALQIMVDENGKPLIFNGEI